MDINSVLNDAKKALSVKSDYALAKALEIHSGLIADYRKGKRTPDAYACGRLAEVLGRDALGLIAEVEADTEKNATRAAWWRRFLSSMPKSGGMLGFALWSWGGSWLAEAEKILNEALRQTRAARFDKRKGGPIAC